MPCVRLASRLGGKILRLITASRVGPTASARVRFSCAHGRDGKPRGDWGSRFWVTCYTDASFTPTAAGWGVWLRSARGPIVRHGCLSTVCEQRQWGGNGSDLHRVYLARKAWGEAVRGLVVYTDSQAAVGFLCGEACKARIQRNAPGIAKLRERIRTFSSEHGIELDLRWLKGHQRTNTLRAYRISSP